MERRGTEHGEEREMFSRGIITLLFLTLFISPRDTKKPVSQDQLVTSRELWSGEGAEETKATAVLASWRGDKVTRSSFQAISVTSRPCPGKVDLTAERWPARTRREDSKERSLSLTRCPPLPQLHACSGCSLLSLHVDVFIQSASALSRSPSVFLKTPSPSSPQSFFFSL
ncbi:hypothetical protein Q5P01_007362 [Channa striata]|uniref:Uncharacterized protein n=1 Tax=Channa striata TaxID=64152 RepID=A0AA88NBX4_CHASR|nr:hypothetical protein Q5P01_007362 [Channa striata]